MAVQATVNPEHRAHMHGDVPALVTAAALLAWLSRRAVALPPARTAT